MAEFRAVPPGAREVQEDLLLGLEPQVVLHQIKIHGRPIDALLLEEIKMMRMENSLIKETLPIKQNRLVTQIKIVLTH